MKTSSFSTFHYTRRLRKCPTVRSSSQQKGPSNLSSSALNSCIGLIHCARRNNVVNGRCKIAESRHLAKRVRWVVTSGLGVPGHETASTLNLAVPGFQRPPGFDWSFPPRLWGGHKKNRTSCLWVGVSLWMSISQTSSRPPGGSLRQTLDWLRR